MNQVFAPIILFTYNRIDHTKRTITALASNQGAGGSDLIIYSDGPKNDAARPAVESVRAFLKTVTGFKSVTIIERDRNWGLADSIIDGVTKIINERGSAIILEDDIVTSPYFLQYMNEALMVYQDEHTVMHISGYAFPINTTGLPTTFFYNQASCWGWATWKRAWDQLDTNIDSLLKRAAQAAIPSHEYNNIALSQLRANKRKQIKTWAARWQISISLAHAHCLHPRNSFTQNIGHDGSGVHSLPTDRFDTHLSQEPISVVRESITEHQEALARINHSLRSMRPSLGKRIYTRLRQLL
jgi:hypothetical protein